MNRLEEIGVIVSRIKPGTSIVYSLSSKGWIIDVWEEDIKQYRTHLDPDKAPDGVFEDLLEALESFDKPQYKTYPPNTHAENSKTFSSDDPTCVDCRKQFSEPSCAIDEDLCKSCANGLVLDRFEQLEEKIHNMEKSIGYLQVHLRQAADRIEKLEGL